MRMPFCPHASARAASSRPRWTGNAPRKLAAAAVTIAAAFAAGCSHAAPAAPAASAVPAASAAASAGTAQGPLVLPAGWSLIATVNGTVPRFAVPGGQSDGTVPARWYGGVSSLPVISQRPGWLRVRLVTRPNGSTAWVRTTDVTLSATPYRIVVNLATRHLQLFEAGKQVMNAPAAIGTKQDPTPPGQYFVAIFEHSPSAGYGPFIIVTSAHSTSIADWEKSGDAVVGIHGPLGDSGLIGTDGAVLSHGCIRLQIPDLIRLRPVPAGTPITITA